MRGCHASAPALHHEEVRRQAVATGLAMTAPPVLRSANLRQARRDEAVSHGISVDETLKIGQVGRFQGADHPAMLSRR